MLNISASLRETAGTERVLRSCGHRNVKIGDERKKNRIYLSSRRKLPVFFPVMVPKHSKNTITWQTSVYQWNNIDRKGRCAT